MFQENLYLENRKVLKVSGLNCVDFLNNILTSDISKLKPLETIPAALLSPQGKVLYDMLVSLDFQKYSEYKSILIEYDLFCEDELIKKLNMYNLRKEVKIEKTNYYVHVSINPKCSDNSLRDKRFSNAKININRIYYDKKPINLIVRCSNFFNPRLTNNICATANKIVTDTDKNVSIEIKLLEKQHGMIQYH